MTGTYTRKKFKKRAKKSFFRAVVNVFIFITAFVFFAGALKSFIPSPLIPSNISFISPKYDYFKKHNEKYNSIFFGSSRVYNQVDPNIFDREISQFSDEIDSFNFGIPALRTIPEYFLIRDVLREVPANLKWVFVEISFDKGYEPIENARTSRSIYWHTLNNLSTIFNYVFATDASYVEKVWISVSHLVPFAYKQINMGRMLDQVFPSVLSPQDQENASIYLKSSGYMPLTNLSDPEHLAFKKNLDTYFIKLKELIKNKEGSNVKNITSKNEVFLIRRIIQCIESIGAKPVFIVAPHLEVDESLLSLQHSGEVQYVLDFSDPNIYPDLYDVKNHYDEYHLNKKGSEIFSEHIANEFLKKVLSLKSSNIDD